MVWSIKISNLVPELSLFYTQRTGDRRRYCTKPKMHGQNDIVCPGAMNDKTLNLMVQLLRETLHWQQCKDAWEARFPQHKAAHGQQ